MAEKEIGKTKKTCLSFEPKEARAGLRISVEGGGVSLAVWKDPTVLPGKSPLKRTSRKTEVISKKVIISKQDPVLRE